MLNLKKITGLAAAALMASAVSVQASPWSITPSPGVFQTLSDGTSSEAFDPEQAANIPAAIVPGTTQVQVGGTLNLLVNAPALKFTYLGKEAGANNAAFDFNDVSLFNNFDNVAGAGTDNGTAIVEKIVGPASAQSPLVFSFTTNFGGGAGGSVSNGSPGVNPGDVPPALAFLLPSLNSNIVYFFLDDGGVGDGGALANCASGDCDWDDMYGSIEVVPLPAAAWLLLAGLGGMGLVARRRKAA